MRNYNDLRKKMEEKNFIFENYGKTIKRNGRVYTASGFKTSKIEALYRALDNFFRENNYSFIMEDACTADFEKMLERVN